MNWRALVIPAAGLAACAAVPGTGSEVTLREVGRAAICNTPDALPRAELLAGADAVRRWQAARGIELVPAGALRDRAHVLVELGPRPTGGYAITLAPAATVRDGRVAVTATVRSPAPGAMVSQGFTSPCVLAELPRGDYRDVAVRDASGEAWGPARTPGENR